MKQKWYSKGGMIVEVQKSLVRGFIEQAWNKQDPTAFDTFLAPDFVDHDPDQGAASTIEGIKQSAKALYTAFPDLHVTIDDMIAEENKVVLRLTMHGTHQGALMGIAPTERAITMDTITILRLHENRVVERWSIYNNLGFLQQLGVTSFAEIAG